MEVISAQSDGFIPQGPFTAKGEATLNATCLFTRLESLAWSQQGF